MYVYVYMYPVYVFQYGDTAVMLAAENGHTDVVGLLIDAKADLDLQNKVCFLITIYISFYLREYIACNYVIVCYNYIRMRVSPCVYIWQ